MNKSEPNQAEQPRFPQRDDSGRIQLLPEFLAFVLMSIVVAVGMLAALDLVFVLLGFGSFGQISGFICGVLSVFIFFEEFRAWRDHSVRWAVAPAALALGLAAGMGALTVVPQWWLPLFAGALAVALGALVYAVLWFTGMRLTGAGR